MAKRLQVALTSICQEGLRWVFAGQPSDNRLQEERLPFLTGLAIVAARLASNVAAQVAALATSLAGPYKPDDQELAWEPYTSLLQVLSGQSKVKPTARCVQALLHVTHEVSPADSDSWA